MAHAFVAGLLGAATRNGQLSWPSVPTLLSLSCADFCNQRHLPLHSHLWHMVPEARRIQERGAG